MKVERLDVYVGWESLVELTDGGSAVGIVSKPSTDSNEYYLVDKKTKENKPFSNGRTTFTADDVDRCVPNIDRVIKPSEEEQRVLNAMAEDVRERTQNAIASDKKKPTSKGMDR